MLGAVLSACTQDLNDEDFALLKGECRVAFELQGMPLASALTRTSGDAIRSISNLYILFYESDSQGGDSKLAYAFTTDAACKNSVFDSGLKITSTTEAGRTPGSEFDPKDGEWKGVSESTTQRVTTSEIQIRRGNYAVYVVANVDDFSSASFSADTIATPKMLRQYSVTWNKDRVKENNAMFGFFTEDSQKGYDVINEAAPVIHFSANTKKIHAWVKRVASKVTVAFDGSRLRDGVRIYIKDVAIHDIPLNCKLGESNVPGSKAELITNGEQIVYSTAAGVTNATRISSREPYFPGFKGLADDEEYVARWRDSIHSETAEALYFFENRQGKSSGAADGNGSWKQQTDINGNNIPDDRDSDIHSDIDPNKGILKDTKEFGSYIEVNAYYQNDNFGAKTEGTIIYRFMLGKNTTDDFDADRNNHYKLTMCFNYNANDVDWHIDYTDKEDIYIPDTIYVSYQYNTPSMLPIRIVGDRFTSLNVQITESHWYPDDSSIPYYKGGTTSPSGLPAGFLSLSYDENPKIGGTGEVPAATVTNYWKQQPTYDPNGENTTTNKNEVRQYIRDGKVVKWSDLEPHGYAIGTRVNSDNKTVFEANIPLFTRPLIIYKWTSWTGANPYYSASRTGKIVVSGTLSGRPYTKTIKVVQVPRIENPSGIYRRHDNTSKFDVTLMERKGEGGTHTTPISYAPFNSKGLWRAIIYRSTSGSGNDVASWFTLTAGSQRAKDVGDYIQGDTNAPIEFTYKPNGEIGQNQVRCGIIKVEYNDYTCTHYVFVRQGYAPMQLESGKVYWHTFNLYSGRAETSHPCDAGSLFLRGLWAPAILDSNTAGFGVAVSSLSALTNEDGTTTGTVSIPISNSGSYKRKDFPTANRSLSSNNTTFNPWNSGRVPTLAEWSTLKNEVANALIDKAFGVLYGDGATTTQTTPVNVNGCLHSNVNTKGETQRGMRGSFVYNSSDGRNIFFPIGASGYGRRKVGYGNLAGTGGTHGGGRLQYSFSDTYFASVLDNSRRPLLYNLNTNEGAIYWGQAEISNSALTGHSSDNGWDINYKTYDFDYMEAASSTASSNRHSACYIRLVQTDPPK